jgi:hypothetical protein
MGMEATSLNQNSKINGRERLNHPKENPDDGRCFNLLD